MVYSNYAQEEIFSVKIRSSNMEEDGKFKYITLACSYLGKNIVLQRITVIHSHQKKIDL